MSNLNNPVKRVVAVNGSAGAYVLISASVFAGYIEIQECPPSGGTYDGTNFTAQGLNVQRADESYATTYGWAPGAIWQIGDAIHKNRREGVPAMTLPNGEARAATPYVKVRSATVTATQIEIREWRQRG